MEKVFPYCKFNDNYTCSFDCSDASLEVKLSYGSSEIVLNGMVDSGCTRTLVNKEIAEVLGLNLSGLQTTNVTGVSGEALGYMAGINFEIEGLGEPFEGPAIFVENLPVSILLGQNNFFEKFDIHFQKKDHKFTLKRVG